MFYSFSSFLIYVKKKKKRINWNNTILWYFNGKVQYFNNNTYYIHTFMNDVVFTFKFNVNSSMQTSPT